MDRLNYRLFVYLSAQSIYKLLLLMLLICCCFRQTNSPICSLPHACAIVSVYPSPARPPARQREREKETGVMERGRCSDCLIDEGQVFHPKSSSGCLATSGVTGYPSLQIYILYPISLRRGVFIFLKSPYQ